MNNVYEKVCEYIRNYPGGIAWRLKRHSKVIQMHLNPEENILFAFCGQKTLNPYDWFNTCIIAITNKRLLIGQKKLLWGYTALSITPDMYNDLTVKEGLFFGRILIDTVKEEINISKLSKNGLRKVETEITEYMIKEKQKYQVKEDVVEYEEV